MKTSINKIWQSVGVFPTPKTVVSDFTQFTLELINDTYNRNINMLDLFAGDGRLGYTLSISLKEKVNQITYLEIRKGVIPNEILNGNTKIISRNGYEYTSEEKFHLIVSNPPYLSINTNQAKIMGFSWGQVTKNGRNLFGLGISKGLELCKPGGILSVIAPFGYLRGFNSAEFRLFIENECSEVVIKAKSDRSLFIGVNQDIAFQAFKKRKEGELRKTKWKFTYDDSNDYRTIHVSLPLTEKTARKYVRVGPIVWNRKKEFLKDNPNNNILVIYGGNITHEGNLSYPLKKYKEKQYITKIGTIPTDLLSAPFIVIRRTLRGKPGSWIIDSALIKDKLICTAENHVIIVELPKLKIRILKEIQTKLVEAIKTFYFDSGSPNLSTKIVGQLYSKLIENYI